MFVTRVRRAVARSLPVCLAALLAHTAQAQVPPVVPGFPHNVSCTPGQLLYRQVGLDRVTNIIYHNGRIYSNNVGGSDRREWLFTNPNDPASLAIVNTANMPFMTDSGNHAHTKSGDYAGGALGMYFRRVSPGVNANGDEMPAADRFYSVQTEPAGGSMHRLYWPWATPFNWIQYGANSGSARLWRANQLLAEWQPLADHGVAGNSILVGNLLFIISDASMLGVLVYDIGPTFETPPRQPQLLDKFTGPVGAYLGAVWQNYLVLAGGADQTKMFVIDYADPTDLRLVATIDLTGNQALDAGTNVPYVQTQDQYVFARRHKVDMESLQPVLQFDEVGNNRPAGSVAGQLDMSQYNLPVGQFLITGSYSFAGRDGVGVWCHQATPDTRAPYIGYHIPRPGQTNYPVGAPISLIIAEELESFTIINGVTVSVRPIGGQPVDAWTSFSHDGVLTITPKQYLLPNTTYEVIVAAGGIKDISGNGIEPYTFSFSTGGSVAGGNAAPNIANFVAAPGPVTPGQSVNFTATATDPEGDALQYRFSFGDGTPAGAWSSSATASHAFASNGHYQVKVQVRDLKPGGATSTVSDALTVTATNAVPANLPTNSSTMALDATRRQVWVVNPDNDSVSRLGADTRALQLEVQLGALTGATGAVHPTSVAVAANGDVWVTARELDRVLVLSNAGALLSSIDTGYGSAPQAVAMSRDGARAYVTLNGRGATDAGNGQLVRYATATRSEVSRVELGPSARAIAITADASRVFVSRFISREHYGEVWEVNGNTMALRRTLPLWRDRGLRGLDSGGSDGPGVPNYVSGLVLSPQQDWLWYTAIKDDTYRGEFFRLGSNYNLPLTHDSTLRPVLGRIDLGPATPTEPGQANDGASRTRVDVDNADSPSALAFSPRGDYAFVALQGNDLVAVFDDLAIRNGIGRSSLWRLSVGSAPQGLLFDATANALWVQNFLSRNVSVYPLANFIASGDRAVTVTTAASSNLEGLPPTVLSGKRTFYFAGNRTDGQNKMSFEGYLSCASCHLDGAQDGRTWDFTQRGEGLRNTATLQGRSGTSHGNVHWSGNFDEIEDFILDIVNQFRGKGMLPAGQLPNPALGAPNHGRSAELDALGDYVASLGTAHFPKSPYRAANGTLSANATAGASVFATLQCGNCHAPSRGYTDSALPNGTLHDVGTLRNSSGQRLGQPLTGIDTPTLHGIWSTAPYFHDGSADNLDKVFAIAGGRMLQAEAATLGGGAYVPQYGDINGDSSFHGDMVSLDTDGASVTFAAVDGGSGGNGAVEMRFWPGSPGTLRLTVNGSFTRDLVFPQQRTHFEWLRGRFEDVPLNAGTTNTIEIRRIQVGSWQGIGLDDITVSTAADRLKAQPHRAALALSGTDMARLKAYLLELDGRNAQGVVEPSDVIFANGFD